jgi:phenylalanyl-tRNA synthetase beta chain
MNIKILDSWLREYLKTDAKPKEIATSLSLTSVSVERMEMRGEDVLYEIEVTTNRSDLMSVVGLAREASAVLPQFGYKASFNPPPVAQLKYQPSENLSLNIIHDEKLVYRICAVVMNVDVMKSPEFIRERLESTDIRSLNNLIDITNYIMRLIGHPTHVFDYDRIIGHTIKIRESQKGEEIITLDGKRYSLPGGDIIAEDAQGNIIDLLGIMGLENSVVTDKTKRIIFFINNNDPYRIRKTSMALQIRTEAAQLNEKYIDPELADDALALGIDLYKKYANGKLCSEIIDIYPSPYKSRTVSLSEEHLHKVMAIPLSIVEAAEILKRLGFPTEIEKHSLKAEIPSFRANDITIPEDLIEEIARVYGYHNLPSRLPNITYLETFHLENSPYYWEDRVKQAMKFWGYTEVYTYPMVSEEMYEGPIDKAVTIANPLGEDFLYMRRTLVPSLLKVIKENKQYDTLKLFEIANIYERHERDLPKEIRMFAGVVKKKNVSFFEIKGLIEQLATDLGITNLKFEALSKVGLETLIKIGEKELGTIEVLDEDLINFELNFEILVSNATLKKRYRKIPKYPPIIEDLAFIIDESIPTGKIIETIKRVDPLIKDVTLFDRFGQTRTFHILYQHEERNLTNDEVSQIRNAIIATLDKEYKAQLK